MALYITPSGRLYDSEIGRFLSRDPVPNATMVNSSAQGAALGQWQTSPFADVIANAPIPAQGPPNPYLFARSNPIGATDPTGLQDSDHGTHEPPSMDDLNDAITDWLKKWIEDETGTPTDANAAYQKLIKAIATAVKSLGVCTLIHNDWANNFQPRSGEFSMTLASLTIEGQALPDVGVPVPGGGGLPNIDLKKVTVRWSQIPSSRNEPGKCERFVYSIYDALGTRVDGGRCPSDKR